MIPYIHKWSSGLGQDIIWIASIHNFNKTGRFKDIDDDGSFYRVHAVDPKLWELVEL